MGGDEFLDIPHIVDCVRFSAKKDWRNDFAKGIRLDDLMANHLERVETVVIERPGGRVEVLVRLTSRRPNTTETFLYKFERIAGYYRQTDGV